MKLINQEYEKNKKLYNGFIIITFIQIIIILFSDNFKSYDFIFKYFNFDKPMILIIISSIIFFTFQLVIIVNEDWKSYLTCQCSRKKLLFNKFIICFSVYVLYSFILFVSVNPDYYYFNPLTYKFVDRINLIVYFTYMYLFGILPLLLSVFIYLVSKHVNYKSINRNILIIIAILFYITKCILIYGFYQVYFNQEVCYCILVFYLLVSFFLVKGIIRVVEKLEIKKGI